MPEVVTIYVNGTPVQVPVHTSASEIRRIAHIGQNKPLARAAGGRNRVAGGAMDVSEGDRFVVGRPFTKGTG